MTRRAGLLSLILVLCCVLAGSAAASATRLKQIGRASSSGDFAVATADGDASRPRAIYVQVTTSTPQSVSVTWVVTCSRGYSSIGSKSGMFEARAPVRRKLKMPLRNPEDCQVIGAASNDPFGPGGRITITLLADV